MRDSGSSILKQQALRLINLGNVETPHARSRHSSSHPCLTYRRLSEFYVSRDFIYVFYINQYEREDKYYFSVRRNRLHISAR